MRNNQQVEVISQDYDDRGRGEFDAGDRLASWVEEHRDMRVVSIAGDGRQIVAVVEPLQPELPADTARCQGSGWDVSSGLQRHAETPTSGICVHCGCRVPVVVLRAARRRMPDRLVADHYRDGSLVPSVSRLSPSAGRARGRATPSPTSRTAGPSAGRASRPR